ncbi:hypothetical protein NCS52_00003800 [Fusarium sp. LHS14.1]|nr:hypothetical protein NCS52_00003800 [Fusarium sp. LHS14.1]
MQLGKRLGHKKSRNGCLRCKARRVKCDELRPCTNCVRHHVECSLVTSSAVVTNASSPPSAPSVPAVPPTVPSSAPAPSPSPLVTGLGLREQPGPESEPEPYISTHQTEPWVCQSPITTQQDHASVHSTASPFHPTPGTPSHHEQGYPCACQCSAREWMQSLQLFHHYSTSVWRSFVRESRTEVLWKELVPNAALSNDFLMHALLAVSALHFAHFNPEQKVEYQVISSHYSALALSSVRNLLNDINESNCEVFFLFGSLTFLQSLCNVAHPSGPLTSAEVAQSFQLLQGMKCILDFKSLQRWSSDGPLGQLFSHKAKCLTPSTPASATPPSPSSEASGPFQRRLDKLFHLARQLPRTLDVINPQSASLLALEGLRNIYQDCLALSSTSDLPHTWGWPLCLPPFFVDMIRSGDPMALIILAHFAALSWPYEHKGWPSQGWGASVMGMIERVIEEEWREWIEWPVKSLKEGIPVDSMEDT